MFIATVTKNLHLSVILIHVLLCVDTMDWMLASS